MRRPSTPGAQLTNPDRTRDLAVGSKLAVRMERTPVPLSDVYFLFEQRSMGNFPDFHIL